MFGLQNPGYDGQASTECMVKHLFYLNAVLYSSAPGTYYDVTTRIPEDECSECGR